ncbi:hypothetical protein LSH36_419g03007 [Paralvinella palmiformis]|uniref:Transposable element P transposase-like RNase H C-terminal domain-containing protein n=1 Tax=Paralvinella palmiformis TaxID=53620 RepID=A0AAD9JD88_9ANNE|nr:hypothetical protein LSH36_419g03007 [Paralvinella palmiformis]
MCIGFFSLTSRVFLDNVLLFEPSSVQRFLLPFKLSQDHLESFFSAVHQFSGRNNNASSIQFSNPFLSLLRHAAVQINGCVIAIYLSQC